jgi:hypothetical protein
MQLRVLLMVSPKCWINSIDHICNTHREFNLKFKGKKCTSPRGIMRSLARVSVKAQEANAGSIAYHPAILALRSAPHCLYLTAIAHLQIDIREQKADCNRFERSAEMTSNIRLSAVEYEKKKIAIAGVIDFNDANDIKYSKIRLFKHFGVSVMTGYTWFPVPPSTKARVGRPKTKTIKNEYKSIGLKRTHSEDPTDEISALKTDPAQPAPPVIQNPDGNNRGGRKRLKALVEDLTEEASSASIPPPISPPSTTDAASPPPPRQLLTPPKRKRGRPKKSVEAQSSQQARYMESGADLTHENLDDIFGEV